MQSVVTFSIADGQSLSGPIAFNDYVPVAVSLPSGFDGTALTFQASTDGGTTYFNVYDDGGTELSLTVAASRFTGITGTKRDALRGAPMLKVRSGASGAPTNQTGATTVSMVVEMVE